MPGCLKWHREVQYNELGKIYYSLSLTKCSSNCLSSFYSRFRKFNRISPVELSFDQCELSKYYMKQDCGDVLEDNGALRYFLREELL